MSISISLPSLTHQHVHHRSRIKTPFLKSIKPTIPISHYPKKHQLSIKLKTFTKIKSIHQNNPGESQPPPVTVTLTPPNPRWVTLLSTLSSLYPVYVTVGGVVACLKPSTFSWFVEKAPNSYSFTLGFIMLSMGLTLEFKDLLNLFMQRPLSVSFFALTFWGQTEYFYVFRFDLGSFSSN